MNRSDTALLKQIAERTAYVGGAVELQRRQLKKPGPLHAALIETLGMVQAICVVLLKERRKR